MNATDNTYWTLNRAENGVATLSLQGDWVQPLQFSPEVGDCSRVVFDSTELGQWNTCLAAALHRFICTSRQSGIEVDISALPEGVQKLLKLASSVPAHEHPDIESFSFFESTGHIVLDIANACMTGISFIGELALAVMKLFVGRARMRWKDLFTEIMKAGPNALPITFMISFLMGLILAFIGSIPLKWFNAEIYVSSLIGIGICRMMGAVMTGTVMAGRTGASYAAELGTMQTNDEIDALSSMGISPIEFLVLPRFLALTLMLPLLCGFSFLAGILGGLAVATTYLHLSVLEYWTNLIETTRVNDIYVGLITSFVYGVLIAICGCLRGIRCGHSSEAVGQATTAAMVSSIICMIIATFIITVMTVILEF